MEDFPLHEYEVLRAPLYARRTSLLDYAIEQKKCESSRTVERHTTEYFRIAEPAVR